MSGFDLALTFAQTFTSSESAYNSNNGVERLNNMAQVVAGVTSMVANINPSAAFYTNGVAALTSAGNLLTDWQEGRETKPEDWMGLAGNLLVMGITAGLIAGIELNPVGAFALLLGATMKGLGVMQLVYWGTNKAFAGGIDPNENTTYLTSRTFIRCDPLALDLDADGLETTAIGGASTILFDHDGDSIKTGTGWLKGDDAFIALDRNNNGTIDTGAELFGVDTVLATGQKAANGFAALADLDSNLDGVFNSADTQFTNVRLWRDLNQDGISQTNELTTLTDAGITGINLTSTATNLTLTGGNVQTAAGTYTKANGQTGTVGEFTTGSTGNLDLTQNPFYSEFTTPIPLTAAASAIANMQGSGMVRDLREAASLDAKLVTDVNALSGTTRTQMMSQLDDFLKTWANTSGMLTSKQDAITKNYALIYLPPDMSVIDYAKANPGAIVTPPGTGVGSGIPQSPELTATENARIAALDSQQKRLDMILGVLERFNGVTFVTVGNDHITTSQGQNRPVISSAITPGDPAGGNGTIIETGATKYLPITLAAPQITLLEQSYAQLKESVYDGLVMQTRLKPYLDAVTLSIDESGVRLDYSGKETVKEAANDSAWRRVA